MRSLRMLSLSLATGILLLFGSSVSALAQTAPIITSQPPDLTVTVGQTATFRVTATSTTPLTYAWYRRDPGVTTFLKITGATGSTYTTPVTVLANNNAIYCAYVRDASGSKYSRGATLKVLPATPAITGQPANITVTEGQQATFTVAATSPTPLTYAWYRRDPGSTTFVKIPGETGPTYTTPPTVLGNTGTVFCAYLRNGAGTIYSRGAALKVAASPNAELALPISVHPGDHWMKASVPIQTGMTYLWTVIPGTATATITSGQGTGIIAFSAGTTLGTFQIQANVQNQAGANVTATRTVTVQRGTWLVKDGAAIGGRTGTTATLLPSGRVLAVGGQRTSDQGLDINGALGRTEIYDPATRTWVLTNSLNGARWDHTANLLSNGKVLVAGGWGGYDTYGPFKVYSVLIATSELYDPATSTWTLTGRMGVPRTGHTATQLMDGRVLVAGGLLSDATGYEFSISNAELFNPSTGTWEPTGSLTQSLGLTGHSANLLPNGKVLIAGGYGYFSPDPIPEYPEKYPPATDAEIFDPTTGVWTDAANLGTSRYDHASAILPDGRVLVVGGYDDYDHLLTSAEIYDFTTGTWAFTGSLRATHEHCTATVLSNGKVLVAGSGPSPAELFDPATGTWSFTGSLMDSSNIETATLLLNGTVLLGAGNTTSQLYDPTTGFWSPTNTYGIISPWGQPSTTLLPSGHLLVAGGATNQARIYDPQTRTWTKTGDLGTARVSEATLLPNGKVLVAGGYDASQNRLTSSELYDPMTGLWTPTGSQTYSGEGSAVLLLNGKVLVSGGGTGTNNAELYDPSTGAWSSTGSLGSACNGPAVLLQNGKVLLPGGFQAQSAELYDPATGTWSPTDSFSQYQSVPTATVLQNGTVLVAGGAVPDEYAGEDSLGDAGIYDPTSGTWTPTGSMIARDLHKTVLLSDGRVLVSGGINWLRYVMSDVLESQIYDPSLGWWTLTGSLGNVSRPHTTTLLSDGTVIAIVGGGLSTEIYMP